ncbi:hypothetical protein D3C80_1783990 [compost metagenome]
MLDPDILRPAQVLLHEIRIRPCVAGERIKPAVVQPMQVELVLIVAEQRIAGHFVVITLQDNRPIFRMEGHHLIHYGLAVRPPVHIIADKHQLVPLRDIVRFPQKRVKFPVTAMNIADY